MRTILLVVFLPFLSRNFCTGEIDIEKTIVFGPGIENTDFDLPVRYFYIQLVDEVGKNLTEPPPADFLRVGYRRQEGVENSCHLAIQLLDLKDGSYIVRFRIFGNCKKLQIELTTNGTELKHIAKSPYILEGQFNDDKCFCPKDFDSFSSSLACGSAHQQILTDLKTWQPHSLDFSQVLEKATDRWASRPTSYSFCHYTIFKNEVKVDNIEFLFNLGDWPLETTGQVPVVSWCGSEVTQDIVVPTYDLTEATIEMMGRQSQDIFSMLSADLPKWAEKFDKAVWRGRDSSQERLLLVKLSRENNESIDAAITRFFFFRDLMNFYGPETEPLPFHDFFKYKYVISMDGTVAAYRFPYLLAGNSLIFKQNSEYYEFFYKSLKPMVHYVPFKSDLSDLLEKIEWAKDNPVKVKEIIKNARQFVMDKLLPANIFCYYGQMLKEFSKKFGTLPERVPAGAEKVQQPNWDCECNGQKWTDKKEEL